MQLCSGNSLDGDTESIDHALQPIGVGELLLLRRAVLGVSLLTDAGELLTDHHIRAIIRLIVHKLHPPVLERVQRVVPSLSDVVSGPVSIADLSHDDAACEHSHTAPDLDTESLGVGILLVGHRTTAGFASESQLHILGVAVVVI